MSLGRTVTLNTGAKIPQLGFGTWQSEPGQVGEAVYQALKAGYRHLDLATIYQNQKEVGVGIKRAFQDIPGLKREDIFITSKLWNNQHRPEVVESALDECLAELGLDYLDLYLIHWPVAFVKGKELFPVTASSNGVALDTEVTLVDTWKAVLALPKTKARAVGVSNFTIDHLEGIIKATGVVPAVNQIERHPRLQQPELIKYAAEKNIHITAYSAFGNNSIGEPLIISHPEVQAVADEVAKRVGKTVTGANVILAWSQVGGHSVIPKSVTPSRIVQNFQEVELLPAEIAKIDALGKYRKRFNLPFGVYDPNWDINIFNEPEEQGASNQVNVGA